MTKYIHAVTARKSVMKFWEEETKKSNILEEIFEQIKLASEKGFLHARVDYPIDNAYISDVLIRGGYKVRFVGAATNKLLCRFKVSW